MAKTSGEDFARALAAKDRVQLRAVLADQVDFRALTPNQTWEASTANQVVDEVLLGRWFEAGDDIRELVSVATGRVSDRERVVYRLRVHNAAGDFVVEQQAYYTVGDGKIDWLRILCSGFRPAGVAAVG